MVRKDRAGSDAYRGADRRFAPCPRATVTVAEAAADAAKTISLTGALALGAGLLSDEAPSVVPVVAILLGGLGTGLCFLLGEQAYVRWRLVGDVVAARLSVAFLVYGATVVPLATTQVDGVGGALAQTVGTVAAGAVLLTTVAVPEVDDRCRFLRPFGVVAVLAGLAAWLPAGLPWTTHALTRYTIIGQPAVEVVAAATLVVVSGALTAAGLRRSRRVLTRAGAAFAVLTVVPSVAAEGPTPLGAPLLAAAIQVGALALVIPTTIADTRAALFAVGRANNGLRSRWRDAQAQADGLAREDVERRHEIRSALLAIEGASAVLRRNFEHLGRQSEAELAAAVESEIARLQELVTRAPARPPSTFALRAALRPVVLAHRANGLKVVLDVPADVVVVGHPASLAEAVGNLLVNAAVHAPGARVRIATVRSGRPGYVRLEVVDDGPGLDPDAALREPRADGHGIGLPMAARLVGQDGGRLSLVAGGAARPGVATGATRPGAAIAMDLRLPSPSGDADGADGGGDGGDGVAWTVNAS